MTHPNRTGYPKPSRISRFTNASRAGFSMTEIVIGLAILGAVMAGVSTFLVQSSKNKQRLEYRVVRSTLVNQVRRSIKQIATLKTSAGQTGASSGNSALAKCLFLKNSGGDETTCDVTDADSQVSFVLFRDRGAAGLQKLAGTPDGENPVFYRNNGGPECDTSDNDCPGWRVNAFFWANCAQNASSCPIANFVYVRFQVKPESALPKTPDGDPLGKPWPSDAAFNGDKARFAQVVRVRRGAVADQICPSNTRVKGYTETGKIECICQTGYTQTGTNADGQPICSLETSNKCGSLERLVGIDVNGDPICTPIDRGESCDWINFDDDTARCDPDAWLNELDMGQCYQVTSSTKKSTDNALKCDENQGKCCWEN